MKPHSSKLKYQSQAQQQTEAQQQTQPQTAREFQTAEELIRFDAGQVAPPPHVVERISRTVACEGRPARPWWKRIFRPE
jgi:hypothetical protein